MRKFLLGLLIVIPALMSSCNFDYGRCLACPSCGRIDSSRCHLSDEDDLFNCCTSWLAQATYGAASTNGGSDSYGGSYNSSAPGGQIGLGFMTPAGKKSIRYGAGLVYSIQGEAHNGYLICR